MSTSTKSLSANYVNVRFGVTEKTSRLFMHKVREAMQSTGNNFMTGIIHVDEFVLGEQEKNQVGRSYNTKKKKAIIAVELTEDGKVKRMYAMRVQDFSAKSLQYIFVNHISPKAEVTTDKWKEYRPITKAFNIKQIKSNGGLNFKTLYTMIHQIKSWIRTTYSWVNNFNINRYFNVEDINYMIGFYKSDTGKKLIELTPTISKEIMEKMMQNEMLKFQGKIKIRINELDKTVK